MLLFIGLALVPIYALRLDGTAGMMVDDAWYLLLARALAEGQGYWLVNAPIERILPQYPPGFPALLAPVFAISPRFPDNLWLLKGVSVAAMAGVAFLTWVHLRRDRAMPALLAGGAALGVALTPAFVFLATSTVMSECVFTLALLALVVLAHRAIAQGGAGSIALVGVAAAAVILIRSAGVAAAAAVLAVLVAGRHWRKASVFAAVVAVCLLPWFLHARAHAPTDLHKEVHRGAIVYGYSEQFWMRWAGSPSSGRVALADLPGRVAANIVDVAGRGMGGIFAPVLLRGADESGEEVLSVGGDIGWTFVGMGGSPVTMAVSLALAGLVLWGFVRTARDTPTVAEWLVPISLGLTLVWPFHTFRFLLPLAPFLYVYLVAGLRAAGGVRAARVALLVIAGLHLYDHTGYLVRARSNPEGIDWLARSREADDTVAWMAENLEPGAVVAATNPALVYLRTGRTAIALDTLTEPWEVWRRRGATHAAVLAPRDLPGRSRGPYDLLYQSPSSRTVHTWVLGID